MVAITGAGLQSFVLATYDDLCAALGPPGTPCDAAKSHVEWVLTTPVGPVAVYDYGDCHNCHRRCSRDPRRQPGRLAEWHIGAHGRVGAERLLTHLNSRTDRG